MSLRQLSFVTILAITTAISFPACNKVTTTAWAPPPVGSPTQVTLTTGTNGACLQNGVEGGNLAMRAEGVEWSTPTANTIVEIDFPAGCPFAACHFGPSAAPIPSGASAVPPGTTATYNWIRIGGNNCAVGGDGIVMR